MAVPASCADGDEEDIWKIPDKSLDLGVKAVFSSANQLFIFRADKEELKADGSYNILYDVKCTSFLHNQFTRKLVNESHGVFLSSIKFAKGLQEPTQSQSIIKISQKYRSVLLACMEDLDKAAGNSDSEDNDFAYQREMFSEIELIWSLMEVLLFDVQSRVLVLYRLLEWVQWHFADAEKKVEDIMNSEEPCEHQLYWDTVYQFILQGKISPARSLLRNHKLSNRDDFLSIDELLRKMPMYTPIVGFSLNEFNMRWRHWQEKCRRRLEESEFSALEDLEIACKILCGDKDVLTEKSYLCGTWYHLLISVLLYTDPCISATSLGQLARPYSSNANSSSPMSNLESIILATMELDVLSVIKDSCAFKDGWWFVAHMSNLLYQADILNDDLLSQSQHLREYLFLNYADSLMSHGSLWQVGVDYLDQCPEHGRSYLELYLERVPINSETKARKILYLAKQRNMHELVRSVCKVMAVRAIKNEKFGTALDWVVLSKDAKFASDLAKRWIKEYSETGKFECFEILNNLGFRMLVSDELTFVGKYCEFHKLYQEREFKKAGSLLVSLLSSGLVPETFQIVMLLDALPLLEAQDPIFTSKETKQLMICLEGLENYNANEENIKGLQKKKRLIHVALCRNLARAFFNENSVN